MTFKEMLKAYAKVSRMEYAPAEAPGMLIPFLLGASSITDMIGIHIIEGIAVFILLFFSGFLINALADINVDSKYKTFVSESVHILGAKRIKYLIIGQVTLGLLLTVHICYLINNYWLFLWVITGTFFGLAYSIKPFHFKVRGVLHATLAFGAGLSPMIFLYYIIAGVPPTSSFLVILLFIILHYGIALVNQTQDYLEDKSSGLLTPAVRWGVTQTLTASLVISLFGLFLGGIGFYILFNDLPTLTLLGYTLSFELLYLITILTLICAYYTPIKGIWDLIMISSGRETIEERMMRIKTRLNYPRWQASGILGITIVSAVIFTIKAF